MKYLMLLLVLSCFGCEKPDQDVTPDTGTDALVAPVIDAGKEKPKADAGTVDAGTDARKSD